MDVHGVEMYYFVCYCIREEVGRELAATHTASERLHHYIKEPGSCACVVQELLASSHLTGRGQNQNDSASHITDCFTTVTLMVTLYWGL